MSQWQLKSSFHVNSALARRLNVALPEDYGFEDGAPAPITGSYAALLALCAHLRWHWVTSNGYDPIILEREPGLLRWRVLAHFGAPEYELCQMRNLAPAKTRRAPGKGKLPYSAARRACDSLAHSIDGIYIEARRAHLSSEALNKRIDDRIYSSADYQRLPQYLKSELRGARECCQRDLYRGALQWRVMFRGALIPGDSIPSGHWNEVDSNAGAMVYKDAPEFIFWRARSSSLIASASEDDNT